MQVGEWNKLQSENKPFMCTARPNWLSLSTTFFNKEACHKIPIPLYDILELNEEKMTVRVEPMVSVGDITKYLIPKGYTLAVTLEIAGKNLNQNFRKQIYHFFGKYLARKIFIYFCFFCRCHIGRTGNGCRNDNIFSQSKTKKNSLYLKLQFLDELNTIINLSKY